MPRSGTTLVEQILAGHPDVYAAGELCDLAAIILSPRDSHDNTLFPEAWRHLDSEVVSHAARTYLEQLRQRPIGGAKRVTDKMPDNFEYVGMIGQLFPSARIIHVRRDPMDTCLSIFVTLFATGHDYAYDITELGTYYRLYESLMQRYRASAPANMLEVSYEALVENLESEVRRILAFCGLGFVPACLAFHERSRPVHTASVAQVREPLYRSSVGKWRRYERQLEPLRQALALPMPQLRSAATPGKIDAASAPATPPQTAPLPR